MPQLMPFMWISSVFISFFVLLVLVLMYSFLKSFFLEGENEKDINFFMKW